MRPFLKKSIKADLINVYIYNENSHLMVSNTITNMETVESRATSYALLQTQNNI